MTPFVKICGLRHAAAVEAAVAAGADAVGFVFAPSVRRVSAHEAELAAKRVPRQVLRVAVMLHPSPEEWREVAKIFRPDVLQTDAADFEYLDVPPEIARWPVLREGTALPEILPDPFVYEGATSGCGERVDWRTAATLAKRGRMLLAGGLDRNNVARAIAEVAPWGLDVSSAVESTPGTKDPALIQAFLTAAKGVGSDHRKSLETRRKKA